MHTCTFGTLTVRKELDVINTSARVMGVLKRGFGIKTIEIDRPSDCGGIHRVTCYVLEVGAVAPAPTDKTDGINWKETDKSENSMEGSL